MKIPHHVFSPSNIGLPYAKEIMKHMAKPGLWIQEHDVEMGPETTIRFLNYIKKEPRKIHAAPYLYLLTDDDHSVKGLTWVHRRLQTVPMERFPKQVKARFINFLPGTVKPEQVKFAFAVPIQGGEEQSEYYGLGCTYIPYHIWNMVMGEVIDIDWVMLDTRMSQATMRRGEKAQLHWDCVASHANVKISRSHWAS